MCLPLPPSRHVIFRPPDARLSRAVRDAVKSLETCSTTLDKAKVWIEGCYAKSILGLIAAAVGTVMGTTEGERGYSEAEEEEGRNINIIRIRIATH